ncbi:hypothetical protein K502DRAFT_161984 [Neoconidiobolus thromboides FSU 785]|nr:hypothetical protein K502DRAFT_161984 [Neoconidiobolus thromboides FSU 785]
MEIDSYNSFHYTAVGLIFAAILLNTFLIYFCLRIKTLTRDLKLIIAIAAAEYFVPIVVLIDYIYYCIHGERLIHISLGCQVLGFLTTVIYYFEILLNVFLAAERLCKVLEVRLPGFVYFVLYSNTLVFLFLLSYCTSQNLMIPATSELTCVLAVTTSILGSITYHYLLFGFFLGIVIISFCYYKLAKSITNLKNFIEIEAISNRHKRVDSVNPKYNSASIKIYIILILYTICMFGSIFFHLLESSLHYTWGKINQTILITNQVAQILFIIGILTNSTLLLTIHTGIRKEVTFFYRHMKCW